MQSIQKRIGVIIAVAFVLGFLSGNAVHAKENGLLQFSAGGHVLGFEKTGMYAATGSHVLRIGFGGTEGVTPQAADVSKDEGKTQPLQEVSYPELWPGITLAYTNAGSGLFESTYYVEPHADVNAIQLVYNVPVETGENGALTLKFETGSMTESAPRAWQEIGGRTVPVPVAFRKTGTHEAGFEIGIYNAALPLIIDPVLTWNTFLGSSNNNYGDSIAVDALGNVYVAGRTLATWGSPVRAYTGSIDAYVAKLNSNGILQWNTFLGSANDDYCDQIALDASGNIYVSGTSFATWGTPVNAHAGGTDAYVAKLNSAGVLQWHTFMGTANTDYGQKITVDGTGNVYLAGFSYATWGSPVNAFAGGADAYVAKLNSSGTRLWHTFMGSSVDDYGYGIAVDVNENVYIGGISYATWGSPVNAFAGGDEVFIAKLNSSGTRLWNTFLGGAGSDYCVSIASDGTGNVYITGQSKATWGVPVNPFAGDVDAFAAKLNSSGTRLWHTFMGSAADDGGAGIKVDGAGNVYVAGRSLATWGTPVNPHAGGKDTFAAKLNSNGVLQWNTFMGSATDDPGTSIVMDENGNVYVSGSSDATWGSPIKAHSGGYDAFAVKLAPLDFGDAPDPAYPTLLANDGARHIINQSLFLGATIDDEPDGQPNATASGDDIGDIDDENGVTFDSLIIPDQTMNLTITASNTGKLDAWIDFNRDGDWSDAGEQVLSSQALSAGANDLTVDVPIAASTGQTFARFRFSSAGGLSYTGLASDGEVEDYAVTILADADGDGEPDITDSCPADPDKILPGVCGCGISDVDTDGDGTLDCNDGCPKDADKTMPGQCGCGKSDRDSDTDGTANCNDGCPNDSDKTEPGLCGCGASDVDTDGDGAPDCIDGCPNDPLKTASGLCGCGVADVDTDDDGTPDCTDNDQDDQDDDDDAPTCGDTPLLISPTDGVAAISLTPTFEITYDIDPETCGAHHKTRWQISEDPDFHGLTYNKNTFRREPVSHRVAQGTLKPNTTYYWRAKVWCGSGCQSEYSEVFTFTTGPGSNDANDNGIPDDQEINDETDLDEDGQPDTHGSNFRGVNTVVGFMPVAIKVSGNITFLQSLNNKDQAILAGMPNNMPWGLINFRIEITNPGDTVQITIYFGKKAPKGSAFYKYDSENGWIDYSEHAIFTPDMKSVTIEVQDGGFGDMDGIANGVIVDPCGIGTKDKDGSDGGGCFIDTMLNVWR